MQSKNLKRLLAAGGALVIVGAAVAGVSVVSAQTAPTATPQSRQDLRNRYDQALANRLHVTVDQLKQAIADARKDVGSPDPATRPAPAPGQQPGARRGPGGFGIPGGPGFAGRGFGGFLGQEADAVAALFKEDRAALIAELPGKTIEEVATAHGVTSQQVTDTITKTANDQIDKFAQARNVPADRVNQLKQRMSERVQEFVTTHRFPARGTGTRS